MTRDVRTHTRNHRGKKTAKYSECDCMMTIFGMQDAYLLEVDPALHTLVGKTSTYNEMSNNSIIRSAPCLRHLQECAAVVARAKYWPSSPLLQPTVSVFEQSKNKN